MKKAIMQLIAAFGVEVLKEVEKGINKVGIQRVVSSDAQYMITFDPNIDIPARVHNETGSIEISSKKDIYPPFAAYLAMWGCVAQANLPINAAADYLSIDKQAFDIFKLSKIKYESKLLIEALSETLSEDRINQLTELL